MTDKEPYKMTPAQLERFEKWKNKIKTLDWHQLQMEYRMTEAELDFRWVKPFPGEKEYIESELEELRRLISIHPSQ